MLVHTLTRSGRVIYSSLIRCPMAVLQKDARHVEWLLRAGADPDQKGQRCQTVKRLASAMGDHEILSLLKRHAIYWKRLASEQEAPRTATGARGGGRKRARNQRETASEADGEGKQSSASKERKARRGTKKARTSSEQLEQPGGDSPSEAEAERRGEEEEEEPMLLVVEESAPTKLRKSRRLAQKRKANS